jgi:hypothetical protein
LIPRTHLQYGVPGYEPSAVPLYGDRATVEQQYAAAEAAERPFFAIERYEEGYAITYDLLPAGAQLAEPAVSELDERVTRVVEGLVGDDARETTEVSRSIGDSLGQLSFFDGEDGAREVAATISVIVLDEDNWVAAAPPGDAGDTFRTN